MVFEDNESKILANTWRFLHNKTFLLFLFLPQIEWNYKEFRNSTNVRLLKEFENVLNHQRRLKRATLSLSPNKFPQNKFSPPN